MTLQYVFSAVASLYLSSLSVFALQPGPAEQPGERYALLVGVKGYLEPSDGNSSLKPLRGPANDVPMVQDLLVKYYHFTNDKAHILPLIGPNATHLGIKKAFESQLVLNAKQHPGALVVF